MCSHLIQFNLTTRVSSPSLLLRQGGSGRGKDGEKGRRERGGLLIKIKNKNKKKDWIRKMVQTVKRTPVHPGWGSVRL